MYEYKKMILYGGILLIHVARRVKLILLFFFGDFGLNYCLYLVEIETQSTNLR